MDQNNAKEFMDVLQDPALGEEIGADEAAVRAAGLTHPDDVELENILAEDWDSVPDLPEEEVFPEEAIDRKAEPKEAIEQESKAEEETVAEEPAEEPEPAQETQEEPAVEPSLQDAPTQVIPAVEPLPVQEAAEAELAEEAAEEVTEEEQEDEYVITHVRKGRPKMKKGYGLLGIPHLISTAIWLAITLVIGISLGRVRWVCCADVMAFGKPPVTAYITVTEEDDIESVSQKLADANLIRYPGLFRQFADITKKSDRINTGT